MEASNSGCCSLSIASVAGTSAEAILKSQVRLRGQALHYGAKQVAAAPGEIIIPFSSFFVRGGGSY
jgi:hypothetical protein